MKKALGNKEIIPVDIRGIRQAVGLTMKQMGERIATWSQGLYNTPIPETRIAEWEFRCRAIPDYVFTASTYILLDFWSDDRHMVPAQRKLEVDSYYSAILNQPLGNLFRLEQELMKSRSTQQRKLLKQVREARMIQQRYLERLLHVRMAYVFEDEPGPGNDKWDEEAHSS